ncbi:MAG: FAD/NAD(P)-binding protein [Planctomycetota bacterium]
MDRDPSAFEGPDGAEMAEETPPAARASGATFDWLIVGGGIHGTHVAVKLLDAGRTDIAGLCIVDPAPGLLARWKARTAVTGMAFLRSPSMHHLDTEPYALQRFARAGDTEPSEVFTAPNDRPSLELFNTHSDGVVDAYGLARAHVRGRASAIEPGGERVRVRLATGQSLDARRVVLALGLSDDFELPPWAPADDERVRHVFDPRGAPTGAGPVCVVGGGISAAQVAIEHARRGDAVVLVSRHAPRVHQYDSEPGWFGPKFMTDYERIDDASERRRQIAGARHRGSMPADVHAALVDAQRRGRVEVRIADVVGVDGSGDDAPPTGPLRVRLSDGTSHAAGRVLLATGFSSERPGGAMVDSLAETASLPVAPCGFPVVDASLRWHPRIHVTGALAELEIGPIARNIAGARRAADRIVAAR